jgi:hypothetical protein
MIEISVTETARETKVKHWDLSRAFLEVKNTNVSLFQPLRGETVKQTSEFLIPYRFESVSFITSVKHFLKYQNRIFVTETARETKVKHFRKRIIEKSKMDYAKELLRFASQSSQSKKDETTVSLPIPTGFDLPDRAKIYRTAYDLWQAVREKMPAWVKYMSLRKAHQNGDHTLAQAHKDAEQAYYAACQQCTEFRYYNQVRQKLFSAQKKSEIDWYEPSHKEASL